MMVATVAFAGAPAKARLVTEVRVGVTAYQNIEGAYARYQRLFQELADTETDRAVIFKVAIGTYGEVVDWYNRRLIDVAVLSAMPVAELLISAGGDQELLQKIKDTYLGTLMAKPESSSTACKDGEVSRSLFDDIYSDKEKEELAKPETSYRTVCIVPQASDLNDSSKLAALKGQSKLRFLFVRPFSVSGYLFPSFYLKTQDPKIDVAAEEYSFTYQHSNTLRRLLESKSGKDEDGKYLVAFVLDRTRYCVQAPESQAPQFKRLQLSAWEKTPIPSEAVLINYRMESESLRFYRDLMTSLFQRRKETEESEFAFTRADNGSADEWVKSYDKVKLALENVEKPRTLPCRFTIDEIIDDLVLYRRNYEADTEGREGESTTKPLRLALVLSGGGAKCAYQAGAISVLEKKLKNAKVAINLVVGTSGGAINALFTSMGLFKHRDGEQCLEQTWQSFKQEDFFQPSLAFSFIFGLSFGVLEALLITIATLLFGRNRVDWNRLGKILVGLVLIETSIAAYVHYFHTLTVSTSLLVLKQVIWIFCIAAVVRLISRWVENWWRQAGCLMVIISTAELFLGWLPSPSIWPWGLSEDHLLQHFWIVLVLLSKWSAPLPLLLGLAMLVTGYGRIPSYDWDTQRVKVIRVLASGLLIIGCSFLLYSLLKESSPSYATGIEQKFASEIPRLAGCAGQQIRPGLSPDTGARLRDISKQIVGERLGRDLIIAASRLPVDDRYEGKLKLSSQANELPDDLYFYYRTDADQKENVPPPPPGNQFVSLREVANFDKLLDIVIGSGTIYPLFPHRELDKIKIGDKTINRIRIIDGGFTHNSPIDAALKWNATHIILIQSSPAQTPFAPHHFLDNAAVALNYLFSQAQNLDTVSRGSVEMFELQPTSECTKLNKDSGCDDVPQPSMDTFDFSRAILQGAYKKGQEDMDSAYALLTRVPGPPLFRETKRRSTQQP